MERPDRRTSAPPPDPSRLRASYERRDRWPVGPSAHGSGPPGLVEGNVPGDPLALFARWFDDAASADLPEPNAMVLATASADGEPDARTVLLKGYGPDGFRFFTNHTSSKALDLAGNPRAALVFPWHALYRQVRVSGAVERLGDDEAASYFHTRPYGSRIGAWASERQSGVLPDRSVLEDRFAELVLRWPDPAAVVDAEPVPLPPFWGGYRVVPERIEFWQGRPNRLHDRLRYVRRPTPSRVERPRAKNGSGAPETDVGWTLERLSP